jgi:hypothetical protein
LIEKFYAVVDPAKMSRGLRPVEMPIIKCGTQIMLEVQRQWPGLPESFKHNYRRYFPAVARPLNTYSTTHFNINWGDILGNTTDANSNGVPDIAEQCGQYFEDTYSKEVTEMGFTSPVSGRYDVYLGNTYSNGNYQIGSGTYGFMQPTGGTASYIVVRENYTGFPNNTDPEGREKGAMKVTAAHEYHHAIQVVMYNSYTSSDSWWMEATSTWMEDGVFNQVNDYVNYLNGSSQPWRNYPHTSLTLFNGIHEYGDVIWSKYLSEKYATASDTDGSNSLLSVWQNISSLGTLGALSSYLGSKGTDLGSAFQDFTVKNLKMDYAEGSTYGTMLIGQTESSYPVTRTPASSLPDYLGSNYLKFNISQSGSTFNVTFDGDDSFNSRAMSWKASLVYDNGVTKTVYALSLNGSNQGTYTLYNLASGTWVYLIPALVSSTGLSIYGTDYTNYPNGAGYTYSVQLDAAPVQPALAITQAVNFPNPMTSATTFYIQATRSIDSTVTIYDLRGNLLRTLNGSGGSTQRIAWDGKDASGGALANGVYLYLVKVVDSDGNSKVTKGKCAVLR